VQVIRKPFTAPGANYALSVRPFLVTTPPLAGFTEDVLRKILAFFRFAPPVTLDDRLGRVVTRIYEAPAAYSRFATDQFFIYCRLSDAEDVRNRLQEWVLTPPSGLHDDIGWIDLDNAFIAFLPTAAEPYNFFVNYLEHK
jgi:hypothetical protein